MTTTIAFHLRPDQAEFINRAASAKRIPKGTFARESALECAARLLKEPAPVKGSLRQRLNAATREQRAAIEAILAGNGERE